MCIIVKSGIGLCRILDVKNPNFKLNFDFIFSSVIIIMKFYNTNKITQRINCKGDGKGGNYEKIRMQKERKYWSIMVLPHTTQEVKVFTISSLKYKLLALGVVATTCTVCLGILLTHLFYTNRSLCNDKEKIIEANMQQQN